MMKLKVEGHPNLVRDSRSKAIINLDNDSYNEYVQKRNTHSKMISMDNDIVELKKSVQDIKDLLSEIIQRLK